MSARSLKHFTLFIILLFFSSCFSEADLGDGYYYLSYGNAIDNGYNEGSTIYKSPQKLCFQTVLIQGGILEVNKSKDYILVGQNKQQKDSNEKTKVFYFWIINKQSSGVYGPFVSDEYENKKKELGVPESLKLKCEK